MKGNVGNAHRTLGKIAVGLLLPLGLVPTEDPPSPDEIPGSCSPSPGRDRVEPQVEDFVDQGEALPNRHVEALCGHKSPQASPVQISPGHQLADVEERTQIGEAVLVEMEEQKDELDLGAQDSHGSAADRDFRGRVPHLLGLARLQASLERVEVEIQLDIAEAEVHVLENSPFDQRLDRATLDRSLVRGVAWTGAIKWVTQIAAWLSTLAVQAVEGSDHGQEPRRYQRARCDGDQDQA